jgi:hypothetical protein
MIVPEHVARLTRGGFDRQQGGDLFIGRGPARTPLAYYGNSERNQAWLAQARKRRNERDPRQ